MSHPYSRNYIHIVFATKECRPWIRDRRALWNLLVASISSYGARVLEIGGTADHVHVLIDVPPKISVVTLVRAMKAESSKSMNEAGHLFSWQKGYGSFSVSSSSLEKVRAYIQRQEEHHKRHSYEVEFKTLLEKHGIAFTPERVLG